MICSSCSTTESKRFITTKQNETLCFRCYKKRGRISRADIIVKEKKEYYQENKARLLEKGKAYASTNAYGFSYCKSNAKRRGIPFELTREQYDFIIGLGCYYCEEKNLPQFGARIDRLDSNKEYTFENCVCACSRCNYLKGDILTSEETKAAIAALKQFHCDGSIPEKIIFGIYTTKVKRIRPLEYSKLVVHAKRIGVECTLTKIEYHQLVSNPCCYCGGGLSQAGYGVDRKSPEGPYSYENCVACCPFCNKIKWNAFTPEETLVIVNATQRLRMIHGQKEMEAKSRGGRAFTEYHIHIKEIAYKKAKGLLMSVGLHLLTSFEDYSQQIDRKKMVEIQCKKGHTFKRSFERIKHILSCPDCTNKSNKHGGFLTKLEKNGWRLLQGEYTNKNSILTVQCKRGHKRIGQYRYLRDSSCSICGKESHE